MRHPSVVFGGRGIAWVWPLGSGGGGDSIDGGSGGGGGREQRQWWRWQVVMSAGTSGHGAWTQWQPEALMGR